MKMIHILILAVLLAYLAGCSRASIVAPTVRAPPLNPAVPPEPLPATSSPAPTAPQAIPTASATVVPSPVPSATIVAPPPALLFSYPIGRAGNPLGDGFFIRHGVDVENTWYNPGYWHTGEDWYAVQGDTGGAGVYAIADGSVEYIGGNYPGRVVIVRHADDLFSMYGHLDPQVLVRVGAQVLRGQQIGTVLQRSDDVPSHLHFEVRTFLTSTIVNGNAPRYAFRCGVNCPPGPGYWPIQAPDLPGELGWRIPTHVIAQRMVPAEIHSSLGTVVVATQPISNQIELWSAPASASAPGSSGPQIIGRLELHDGERFPLLAILAGAEQSRETSALAYQLWYQLQLPDGRAGWVQAAVPSSFETGSDGRPSSVYFNFFPS